MKLIPLKDIKDLFPIETLVRYRLEIYAIDFEDELALLIEDDCEVENLDLDVLSNTFPLVEKGQYIQTILCLKNLKAKNIFNDDDDRSCDLIVIGNLECENMVVGGQDIFIQGNLTISECFWGRYNHGNLSVKGATKVQVFIATEEYHYDEDKNNFEVLQMLTDFEVEDNLEDFSFEILSTILEKNLLSEDTDDEVYSWENWIDKQACIDYLSKGKPLLKKNFQPYKSPEIVYEKHFSTPPNIQTQTDWNSQISNFLKLIELSQLEPDNTLYFSKYIWNYTLTKVNEKYPNVTTVVAKSDDFTVSISFETTVEKSLFKTKTSYSIYAYVRKATDEEGVFIFDEAVSQDFYDAFNEAWQILLFHAERGIHFYKQFLNEVKATELHAFCTLPIVTDFYNDWSDGNLNGFYVGKMKYSFHIPLQETGSAQLRITKQIKSEGEDYDCRGFRFDNDEVENPKIVELLYNYSQLQKIEGRYKSYSGTKVYFFDDELYEEALKWYRKAKEHIAFENAKYVNNPDGYIEYDEE